MTSTAWCVMFVLQGLLLVLLSLPLACGKVPPNGGYGFRTAETLRDPALWYAANRVAGRNLIVAGLLVALCAIAAAQLGLPDWVNVVVLLVAPAAACAHSWWFMRAKRTQG